MIGPRQHLTRLAVLAAAVVTLGAVGCAEKAVMPDRALSPRFVLRVSTTGAQAAGSQKLAVFAVYFSSVRTAESDSFRIMDTVAVPVNGTSQQVELKIDLSTCLADVTRRGSRDACSLYVGAFLVPPTFSFDTSDLAGLAYDYQVIGPLDAAPGKVPVVPSIDLSASRFAINHWEVDEALRLGGAEGPQFFNGPIAGVSSGAGAPTLFALTNGGQITTANGVSTFQNVAQLAINQGGTWRRVNGPANQQFNDVAAFSATDVYMAGTDGLYHYDGAAITPVSAVREGMRSVAVSTANGGRFLIAGTNNGGVWLSNGLSTFTRGAVTSSALDAVCINGANEAYAANRPGGNIFRFDGTTWSPTSAQLSGSRLDLQCLGPGQAYIGTQGAPNALLKWNGSTWIQLPGPAASGRGLNWAVVSPNEIYCIGDSSGFNRAFYRFDGSSWREIGRQSFSTGIQQRPWADPRGAVYVASSASSATRVDMANAGGVSTVAYRPTLRDVFMPSATLAYVVGTNAFLARLNGQQWTVDAPPAGSQMNATLQGVWSDGGANAWAVGSSSTVFRWDGVRWNSVSDVRRPVATPDNYNATWGTGSLVWAVGDATILRCRSTSCANDANPAGGPLYSVWGTSPTNVFAVGAAGRILRFDGSTWVSMSSPTGARLSRVVGTGPTDVWAIGDTVAVHYDGTAWTLASRSIYDSAPTAAYQLGNQGTFQLGAWAVSPRELYVGTWYTEIVRAGTLLSGQVPGPFDIGFGRILGVAGSVGGCGLAVADGSGPSGGPILLRGVGPTGCFGTPMLPSKVWP